MPRTEMTQNEVSAPSYLIESVDSALKIVRMLNGSKQIRVSDVAQRLSVAQSTAHRLLSTLVHHGFARQNERRGEYRSGPALLEIGFAAVRELEVRQYARPILEEVREQTNETVHLGVPYGQDVFYVEGVESRHQLRIGLRIGAFLPAHCVGLGKSLLATRSRDELHSLYRSSALKRLTPNSIPTLDLLELELEEVRATGYARSRGESDDGVGSIAVAIVDGQGTGHAAISVSAPVSRINPEREAQWIEAAKAAAAELRARLWGKGELLT